MVTENAPSFMKGDVVEVTQGWDHHRGWIQVGTRIKLTIQKDTGEWIGAEVGTDRTITTPVNAQKHMKKL